MEEVLKRLFKNKCNNFIFIYTAPKVGSTSLVSSLRISLGHSYNVIHLHDEIMLNVLTGIKNITINSIINYLACIGKNVYVIDVYRSPIERKMSEYFDKLSPYHFNNSEEEISNYSLSRITDRFNNIFNHIATGDNYLDKYNIANPIAFDFIKKYSLQKVKNITYIKLRLCDSSIWGSILSEILNCNIVIIKDYTTESKKLGELYKRFKEHYKLPMNYYEMIKECKYLKYYYSEEERNSYLNSWSKKLNNNHIGYTKEEYAFYIKLYLENQYRNDIEVDHYLDNGCLCSLCTKARINIYRRARNGEKIFKKIIHNEVINEEIKNRSAKVVEIINKRKGNSKFTKNQFTINLDKSNVYF